MSANELDKDQHLVEVSSTVGLVKKLANSGYEFTGEIGVELYAGIFLLGYVIPHEGEASGSGWVEDAKALWSSWTFKKGDREQQMREVAGSLVKEKLKGVIIDEKADTRWVDISYTILPFNNANSKPRPEYIIRCITPSPPGIRIEPLRDILPSREEFDTMLESPSLPSSTTSPSLALLDSTLPAPSDAPTHMNSTWKKYARAVSALLAYLTASRTDARSNLWALRHILVLGFYANEYLRVEDVRDGPALFDVKREHLKDVVEKVKSLTTYLLGRAEDVMHTNIINALMSRDGTFTPEDGSITSFVTSVVLRAKEKDKVRDAAVLGIVLQHLFSDATKDDADLWLSLARRLEKTGQFMSLFEFDILGPFSSTFFSSPDQYHHTGFNSRSCVGASETRQVS